MSAAVIEASLTADLAKIAEAQCVHHDGVATHVAQHAGKCARPLCDHHAENVRKNQARAALHVVTLQCGVCGQNPIAPDTYTVRPI